jgi:hypothetical protein
VCSARCTFLPWQGKYTNGVVYDVAWNVDDDRILIRSPYSHGSLVRQDDLPVAARTCPEVQAFTGAAFSLA